MKMESELNRLAFSPLGKLMIIRPVVDMHSKNPLEKGNFSKNKLEFDLTDH